MAKFLRLPEVQDRTGLSRSSIYLKIATNHFPPPVRLGERAVAWVEEEVSEWIDSRIQKSRPKIQADG